MKSMILIFFMVSLSNLAFAEACTYQEALLALENGNKIRGLTLMQMAANDGDARANHFLNAENNNRKLLVSQLDVNRKKN